VQLKGDHKSAVKNIAPEYSQKEKKKKITNYYTVSQSQNLPHHYLT